jgi:hypothetical protein
MPALIDAGQLLGKLTERVPEALARVTELLWRRALEEARERLKIHQGPDSRAATAVEELQEQVGKLSLGLAEARAREGGPKTQRRCPHETLVSWWYCSPFNSIFNSRPPIFT